MQKAFGIEAQRKYMRIPFKEHGRDFDGCDCGGLVGLVYKTELGIELPDWYHLYTTTHFESFSELTSTIGGMLDRFFLEVPKGCPINPFDAVVFNVAGNPVHVGVAINQYFFMHIMEGYTSVRTEKFASMNWKKRIEGVFRYSGMAGK